MGVGVVVRDWHGKVVAVVAETFYHSSDPTQAEARAAWRAISFCHDLGLCRVHFEGDSINVVSSLKEEPCWTRF
jgi:ribonuclease HI